jgi:hypothetical protein
MFLLQVLSHLSTVTIVDVTRRRRWGTKEDEVKAELVELCARDASNERTT